VKEFPSEPQNRTEINDISYFLWNLKVDCVIHYIPTPRLLNVKEERKAGQKQRRKEEERIIIFVVVVPCISINIKVFMTNKCTLY
jgi:hypothetical protein